MNIAVVGAGVSGLVAASLLHPRHAITVFDAGESPGGHAHTVEVSLEDGDYAVDTGFVVYNERNYPLFSALLGRLGVATQPSEMSFSVSDQHSGLEYRTSNLSTFFARRGELLSAAQHRLLADIVRFQRAAR